MKSTRTGVFILLALSLIGFSNFVPSAKAATPALSVSATGNGDNVQINVTGDPNIGVLLYYVESGSGPQIVVLGNTDSNGYYSTTVSSASLGISPGALVYVTTGGTAGPQSPSVAWPDVSSASGLTLSQSSIVLSTGQSASVTASNLGSGTLYVYNNSNPSIANVSINGNQITFTGNVNGQTTVTFCPVGNTSNCPSVYVTVQNSGTSQLSFSNSSPTVSVGQTSTVSVYGPSGATLYIASNSNPNIAQINISGSSLSVTGINNGSASVSVCSSAGGCGSLILTVSYAAGASPITLSQTALTLAAGQTLSVTVSGGTAPYTVSGGSTAVAQESLNGTILSIYGIASGISPVTVCSAAGGCINLLITVNGASPVSMGILTSTQIQSVLALLQSYGASQAVLNNVSAALNGQTTVLPAAGAAYQFEDFLTVGSSGDEVTQLQEKLTSLGIYSGPVTGYFGSLTEAAVEQFQGARGIEQVGYVGPATRAALNQ